MVLLDLPPPQYDAPYTGALQIEYVERGETHKRCFAAGMPFGYIHACAFRSPDGSFCRIVFPKEDPAGFMKKWDERLMRHELGHCNGWRHE